MKMTTTTRRSVGGRSQDKERRGREERGSRLVQTMTAMTATNTKHVHTVMATTTTIRICSATDTGREADDDKADDDNSPMVMMTNTHKHDNHTADHAYGLLHIRGGVDTQWSNGGRHVQLDHVCRCATGVRYALTLTRTIKDTNNAHC